MGAFHIEDDWYLVPDQYSYNIGKIVRYSEKTGEPIFSFESYHTTIEQALLSYIALRQKLALTQADMGEIIDALNIVYVETIRLQNMVRSLLHSIGNIDFEEPCQTEDDTAVY